VRVFFSPAPGPRTSRYSRAEGGGGWKALYEHAKVVPLALRPLDLLGTDISYRMEQSGFGGISSITVATDVWEH